MTRYLPFLPPSSTGTVCLLVHTFILLTRVFCLPCHLPDTYTLVFILYTHLVCAYQIPILCDWNCTGRWYVFYSLFGFILSHFYLVSHLLSLVSLLFLYSFSSHMFLTCSLLSLTELAFWQWWMEKGELEEEKKRRKEEKKKEETVEEEKKLIGAFHCTQQHKSWGDAFTFFSAVIATTLSTTCILTMPGALALLHYMPTHNIFYTQTTYLCIYAAHIACLFHCISCWGVHCLTQPNITVCGVLLPVLSCVLPLMII